MKVFVDQNSCASSGLCSLTAPDVFDQSDEDGDSGGGERQPTR